MLINNILQKLLTSIKSSSAPLKRKIIGLMGTHPESVVSLAISSIDAAKVKKCDSIKGGMKNEIPIKSRKNNQWTDQHMNHNHQLPENQVDYQNDHLIELMGQSLVNLLMKFCQHNIKLVHICKITCQITRCCDSQSHMICISLNASFRRQLKSYLICFIVPNFWESKV